MLVMYSTTSIDQMRSATELNFEPTETRMVRLDRISVIQERDTIFIAFCTLNAPSLKQRNFAAYKAKSFVTR